MRTSLRNSAAIVLLLLGTATARSAVVNDVSQLDPITVERVAFPRNVQDVQRLVRDHNGPISIGGARHSMGGQIATENTLFLDTRRMDHVLAYSPKDRWITVEPGITWRKIQERIDQDNLSVKIMQSYANFTVGGSLSVNCHGRYVNQGPLIHSVRSIAVVLADGRIVEASPTKNPEIFYGAIGGYGGLGVIASATLELDEDAKVERQTERMEIGEYRAWFINHIKGSKTAVFHNGDIYPPDYDEVMATTFSKTDRDITIKDRLQPIQRSHWISRLVYFWITELPLGKQFREHILDPMRLRRTEVIWRNYEASYDVAELEPVTRRWSTYVLQEYFIPVERFDEFAPKMAAIFKKHRVNVVNVSIRHAKKDPGSTLAWARRECFAFVVYYKHGTSAKALAEVGAWTREMLDAVVSVDGTYYLPYEIFATDDQFHKAYPRASEFFALKRKLDPTYKFRNKLWDRYDPPPTSAIIAKNDAAIEKKLLARKNYRRPEDQTFMTLPEWYIVYSADEYAAFLKDHLPSGFPYFGSVRQFWAIFRGMSRATTDYPFNWGDHLMIWTIGASFTAEYVGKGLYDETVGRFFEWVSLHGHPERRGHRDLFLAQVAHDYAQFIHATPWYEFPFWTHMKDFRSEPGEPWTLRGIERTFEGNLELVLKALWGKAIKKATRTVYDPADLVIEAWVRQGRSDLSKAYPGVRVLDHLGGSSVLVSIPRYENFKLAVVALAKTGASFVEIAGNRKIQLTVIAPAGWDRADVWGEPILEWPLLTDPSKKRIAIAVPVDELPGAVLGLPKEGVTIDHVYDY